MILAETLRSNGQSSTNVVGLKSRSAFSKLVPGLPLSACIEYTHCVLIGVYQALLQLHVKLMDEKKETESFNTKTDSLSRPCEVIDHGRNVRSVAQLKDFKANAFFNYLFNVGVTLLRGRIPASTYHHYLKLFGVRLLLETSAETDIREAENLLDSFCQEAVAIFGREMWDIKLTLLASFESPRKRFWPPSYLFSNVLRICKLTSCTIDYLDSRSYRSYIPTLPWIPSTSRGRHRRRFDFSDCNAVFRTISWIYW